MSNQGGRVSHTIIFKIRPQTSCPQFSKRDSNRHNECSLAWKLLARSLIREIQPRDLSLRVLLRFRIDSVTRLFLGRGNTSSAERLPCICQGAVRGTASGHRGTGGDTAPPSSGSNQENAPKIRHERKPRSRLTLPESGRQAVGPSCVGGEWSPLAQDSPHYAAPDIGQTIIATLKAISQTLVVNS